MARADSPTRLCGEDGCDRPHRARGLCVTHYNQTIISPEKRHPKIPVPCHWCGMACAKDRGREKRYGGLFCSLECRDARAARERDLRRLPVLFVGTVIRTRRDDAHARSAAPRIWTAGRCRYCRDNFVDRQPKARFCSASCGKRYWRRAYRKRSGVPQAIRAYVFGRDGWRCQICMRALKRTAVVPHSLAPTIDHIVPQSQGGKHDPANLRAAHFLCNSRRADRGASDQLALFG